MYLTVTRVTALAAALATLALMADMARPGGDNYAYQNLSGYGWLLALAVWATLPYLMMLFLARKASASKANQVLLVLGALVISGGGVALYVDTAFFHRDPQGGLAFFAVPGFQWLMIGLLTGIQVLLSKRQTS